VAGLGACFFTVPSCVLHPRSCASFRVSVLEVVLTLRGCVLTVVFVLLVGPCRCPGGLVAGHLPHLAAAVHQGSCGGWRHRAPRTQDGSAQPQACSRWGGGGSHACRSCHCCPWPWPPAAAATCRQQPGYAPGHRLRHACSCRCCWGCHTRHGPGPWGPSPEGPARACGGGA
jgi:hypothetical protein